MKKNHAPQLGYLVNAFPRLSQTFILNEILQIERQGVPMKLYSLKVPDEPKRHPLVDTVQSPIKYVPYPLRPSMKKYCAAHIKVFWKSPIRYLKAAYTLMTHSDRKLKVRFVQAGYLAQLLYEDRVQHLHAGFVHHPGTVAWFVHKMTGISFSLATHAKDLYLSPYHLLRKKLKDASAVFTCTKYNVEYLKKTFPSPIIRNLHHVYHGVHLERFPFGDYGQADPPLVLAVARLVKKKGLRNLVKACKILHDQGRTLRCRIIGEGILKEELQELIRDLNMQEIVSLEGAMDQNEIIQWYRKATVFALPCMINADGDRDGIPNVLVEAAASGVPIVSTDVSGIPELIKDGKTGLQVQPNDPEGLARAIARLLDSPELCETLRKEARARVEEQFCLCSNAEKIADEMKKFLGAP